MPEQQNLHWTSEEDLLERYVLDRVEAGERRRLEDHLRECEQCRDAVRAEQQLAAGIREAGREVLKARLKERVAAQPLRRIDWYQVAAAAATIVLLVTIGIHNRWFFSDEAKQEVLTEQEQKEVTAPGDKIHVPEEGPAVEVQPRGAVGESVAGARDAATASRSQIRSDVAEEKRREAVPVTTEKRPEARAEEPQFAAGARKKEAAALDRSEVGETQTWVEGKIISLGLQEPAAEQFPAPQVAKRAERLRARRMDAKVSKAVQLVQADEAMAGIVLEQKAIGDLSPEQQLKQHGDAVQTMIQRKDGTLQMTLYLDRPVSDSVLQNAFVDPVSEDSVVVNLGTRVIGYKLPTGWGEQFTRQVKVKR